MLVQVLSCVVPIILLLVLNIRNNRKHKLHLPPGPKGLPILGNLHQFDIKNLHTYLFRLSNIYGPIMHLQLGFRPMLVISSPRIVKHLMKSHDHVFSSRPTLRGPGRLSYGGLDVILSPYGEGWREMRKLSSIHLLSAKRVKSFQPIRVEETLRLIKMIERNFSVSKVNNLSEMTVAMSSNTICRVAFGKDHGDQIYEHNPIYKLNNGAQSALFGSYVSDYFPFSGWIDRVTGMGRRLEKNFGEWDSFYEELIEEHMDYGNRPKSMEGDFLDVLLCLRRDGLASVDLSLDRIKSLLMNAFIGGIDTMSTFLIWAMTFLMLNQTAMTRVQQEIRQYASHKDFITEEDIVDLQYLRAVIKETFRIYPPAPCLIPRATLEDCTLDGYDVQKGTLVFINAWAIGRDPDIWENPNEFLPERFLESDIDVKGSDPELIPFGIGRRGCPGAPMAMAFIEIVLANILLKFDWDFPAAIKEEHIDMDVLHGVVTRKKNPLYLVAKPFLAK